MQEIVIVHELPSTGQQLSETEHAIHAQKHIRALAASALQEARLQYLSPDVVQERQYAAQSEHAQLRLLRLTRNALRNEMGMNRHGQPLAGGPRDQASYYTVPDQRQINY